MKRGVKIGVPVGGIALFVGLGLGLGMMPACVEQSPDLPSEDDVKVARENVLSAPPANIKFPVNADLEGKVTYLGMDVDTATVTPGKPFTLTHYWKVNETVGDDWKVFVHLEAPGTKASHLNADHVPIAGKYPVSVWKKGEIIRDTHRVSVPAGWKAPTVEIYTGLWKGPLRLKVTSGPHDPENRVLCAKLSTDVTPPAPKKVVARKVKSDAIKLDGKLDEPAWQTAMSTGVFVKTLDGTGADQKTEAKVLWDDKNLYVAFQMEDKDVWATLAKPDDKLWTEEAVEVFIDADGDEKSYVELQTNPKGAIFDSYLPTVRGNQNDWSSNMKVAVNVDGTVDNRDDQDKGWTVEMAIPLEAAKGKEATMKNVPPTVGNVWRVNFFRMDMPKGKPQAGTAWSPPLTGDFHTLSRFGQLLFGDEAGNTAPVAAAIMPVVEEKAADDKKAEDKKKADDKKKKRDKEKEKAKDESK